jgi:hypothetical protein
MVLGMESVIEAVRRGAAAPPRRDKRRFLRAAG